MASQITVFGIAEDGPVVVDGLLTEVPGLGINRWLWKEDGESVVDEDLWVVTHLGSGCIIVGKQFGSVAEAGRYIDTLPKVDWTRHASEVIADPVVLEFFARPTGQLGFHAPADRRAETPGGQR